MACDCRGPTTSSRMDSMEPEFIEQFGVRAIIGKGGMSQPTVDAMAKHGCVYLAFTGGAAVLAAEGITGVRGVEWQDLGMPEAMWDLKSKGSVRSSSRSMPMARAFTKSR